MCKHMNIFISLAFICFLVDNIGNMKRKKVKFLSILFVSCLLTGCSFSYSENIETEEEEVDRTPSISLNASELTLEVGESFQFIASAKNTSTDITWKLTATGYTSSSLTKTYVDFDETTLIFTVKKKIANKPITLKASIENGLYSASCSITTIDKRISVESISLNKTSAECLPGGKLNLVTSYTPSNANYNKDINWKSSDENIATVDNNGLVNISSEAPINSSVTINATLASDEKIKTSCKITVVEEKLASYTVMIYMCGSNLESDSYYSLATADIKEILKVNNQPDDVNIIIQTGGSNIDNSYFSTSKAQRWHVENKTLVRDYSFNRVNMGLSSTFQNFLEWGLTEYPAKKTGVILWNHGGAMQGVCFDELYYDDSLLNSEVNTAVKNAFNNLGRTEKLEWIGYDACLMQVQDIAEFNSQYFNYMVASQETESGYGWDYDNWIDELYSGCSTEVILKSICDVFISDNGGTSSSSNDQTLSYLDLSKMDTYKTAWESLSVALNKKISSNNKESFRTILRSAKKYDSYESYGCFDVKDFVNKLANSDFNPGNNYIDDVLSAHSQLVKYSTCGRKAGNSNGLSGFWSYSSWSNKSTYYSSSETNFSSWRSIVVNHGN